MRVSKFMAALILGPAMAGVVMLPGCSTAPPTQTQTADLVVTADTRLKVIENDFPDVKTLVDQAYAYAMVPEVSKGGLVISAGGGKGIVKLSGDKYWGTCQTEFADFGATIGGETYTELLIIKDKPAFDTFIQSGAKFDTAASATAIQAGTTVKPNYTKDGIALLTYNTKGLMVDASIGVQHFTAAPAKTMTTDAPKMQGPTSAPAGGM